MKVISIRLTDQEYDQIKNDGQIAKIATKAQKIISDHLKSKYDKDHQWMSVPRNLGEFLFSALDEKKISEYCELLHEEIIKVNHTEFPEQTLWDTWLMMDRDWNQKIGSLYSCKKVGDHYHYFLEHKTNLVISKIIYQMFIRYAKGTAKIEKIQLDNNKLVIKITPEQHTGKHNTR